MSEGKDKTLALAKYPWKPQTPHLSSCYAATTPVCILSVSNLLETLTSNPILI